MKVSYRAFCGQHVSPRSGIVFCGGVVVVLVSVNACAPTEIQRWKIHFPPLLSHRPADEHSSLSVRRGPHCCVLIQASIR